MNLTPTRLEKGRKVYWVVRLGKRLTGAAKVRKSYFTSRKAASRCIESWTTKRERLGQAGFALTLQQQTQAVQAFERLTPLGVTLAEVVDHYLATHVNGKPSPLFKDFSESYLLTRQSSCTPHTLANYRSMLKPAIKEFGKIALNKISQTEIEEWIPEVPLSPRTKCNILDTMTTVLNAAIQKNLLTRNPATYVPRPSISPEPPGILTPEQAVSLLCTAQTLRPLLVPALAIALFAGVRRSELCSLTGAQILLDENLIEIPTNVAKNRKRRLVTIRTNLAQWLPADLDQSAPITITHHPDVFGEWLRELAIAAGIQPWPHNAMRHSFASYLYALIKHEGIVAAEMGNTPNVVITNYRAVVRPAAAKAYFDISPGGKKADAWDRNGGNHA